ncbi:MAG: S1 RNA-binding domain-containing protein [Phycisphaeraceae bacterium]|nr:MAG: S1 RNA-binding domain-containing protein [Phycisphaeraceae bacterium]
MSKVVLGSDIEAEVNAAMADMEAAGAAAPSRGARPTVMPGGEPPKPAIRGPRVVQAGREHRTGRVVSVGPTDIFLEFGPKELGILARAQFPEDQVPAVGAEAEVVIDKFEAAESLFICSRPGAVQKAQWELLEPGQVVEARVTGVTKGGLELEVANHRAFMPASQVSVERTPDLSVFVGEKFRCEVVRVERMGSGNIVLSRRNILEQERAQHAEALKTKLEEGQTVEGTVRKIMPFGAFVDLGGVDGLVHLSDMTYDRAGYGEKAVEKYVKEGQRLTVKILKLDWDNNRISLGLKQLVGDPFQTAAANIVEGAELTGRVTKILEFGCFVEISPGVEGLVHISELDHRRVNTVAEVVQPDQIVACKVLKVDPGTRRVSLSIKATKPLPQVNLSAGPGGGGKGKDRPARTAEDILKDSPALRKLREKARHMQFKGGLG